MNEIDKAVTRQLRDRKGHEGALALWQRVWAAYEAGGQDEVERLMTALLTAAPPPPKDGEAST